MTNQHRIRLSLWLSLSLFLAGARSSIRAQQTAAPTATTQQQQRPTPTTPRQPTTQQPPPATVTPTPTASPAPTRTPLPKLRPADAPQTLDDLRARIRALWRDPLFEGAQFGIKVVSLETNRVLYEENAVKLLKPASNMKLYTVAAALARLTPEFRYKTSVYARSRPDASGTLRGDLIVYGRGDPTFAAALNDGDPYKAIDAFAARIVAAGVRSVEGDLIGDETYFNGPPFGPGWNWDDLQWEYGSEISALTVNDNALDLIIKPGPQEGAPCVVTFEPPSSALNVVNRSITGARDGKRNLIVYRHPGESVVTVGGSLPLGGAEYKGNVANPRPALTFVALLRDSLARQGVRITGRTRTVDARASRGGNNGVDGAPGITVNNPALDNRALSANVGVGAAPALIELASVQSVPLSEIAAQILKPSQNLYTELLLRTIGKTGATDPDQDSAQAGLAVVKSFLTEVGVDPKRLRLADGSGLSRANLLTADATLRLLTYMARHRYATVFRDALPVAGVGGDSRRNGTLRNRMKDTPAAGNVRAKTGSLDGVSSLSGYVTSAAGEPLVFSVMINNDLDGTGARLEYIDAVVVLLASFKGRS